MSKVPSDSSVAAGSKAAEGAASGQLAAAKIAAKKAVVAPHAARDVGVDILSAKKADPKIKKKVLADGSHEGGEEVVDGMGAHEGATAQALDESILLAQVSAADGVVTDAGASGGAGLASERVAGAALFEQGAGGIAPWLIGAGVVGVGAAMANGGGSGGASVPSSPNPGTSVPPAAVHVSLAHTSAGDLVNAAESTAAAGVAMIRSEQGVQLQVVLKGSSGSVTKMIVANGEDQVIALSATDLATLGEGAVLVSASAMKDGVAHPVLLSGSADFLIDTVAPAASVAMSGAGEVVLQAESTAAEGVATLTVENGATVVVTLTGTAGVVVKVLTGTGEKQAVVLTAADVLTLGQGDVSVGAVATDAAGNVTTVESKVLFELDTLGPPVTVTSLALSQDTGVSGSDFITNVGTQDVHGTLSRPLELGEVIRVSLDNGATWLVAIASVGDTGFDMFGVTLPANGEMLLRVEYANGNAGEEFRQAVIVDLAPPAMTEVTLSAAENGTAVGQLVATDAHGPVSWALTSTGADNALFTLSSTGELKFVAPKNFEMPDNAGGDGVYHISVRTSDVAGNVSDHVLTVTLTDVNEAPTQVGSISNQTAIVDVAFTLATSGFFSDVDAGANGTLTYTAQGLPPGLTIDANTGLITGTATAESSGSVIVTASDGGGLSVTQGFELGVIDAPTIMSIDSAPRLVNGGTHISVTVKLSEAVTWNTSAPSIDLNINGVIVTAAAVAGINSDTLTFDVTIPNQGNGNSVTLSAFNVNGADIVGLTSGQPLDATIVGQTTSNVTVDNFAPAVTDVAWNAAENGTVVGQLTATETHGPVIWSLSGTSGDNGLFNLSGSGELSFIAPQNFEAPSDVGADGTYEIVVRAEDAAGNASFHTITVTLTDVNEAPTAVGTITEQHAVVGAAYSLATSGYFDDVDAGNLGTLSYSAQGLADGLTIDATTGVISGTATGAASGTVVVTATDGGGLSVTQSFDMDVASAPMLTSAFSTHNVTAFEVNSNIVFTSTEDVTAVSGKFIRLVNTGGEGFHGESSNHTQLIEVTDTSQVTIVGGKITLNPTFDLDLSNNYHIEIDEGAFVGVTSGLASIAVGGTDMAFSTVTPAAGTSSAVLNIAAQAVMMDANGALVDGHKWFDLEGLGAHPNTYVFLDLSSGSYTLAAKDYLPTGGTPSGSGVQSGPFLVDAKNWGANDLLYIDDQTNDLQAANDLAMNAIIHNGNAPSTFQMDNYDNSLPGYVNMTFAGSTLGYDTIADMAAYLGGVTPIVSG